jgi:hypothetical protein
LLSISVYLILLFSQHANASQLQLQVLGQCDILFTRADQTAYQEQEVIQLNNRNLGAALFEPSASLDSSMFLFQLSQVDTRQWNDETQLGRSYVLSVTRLTRMIPDWNVFLEPDGTSRMEKARQPLLTDRVDGTTSAAVQLQFDSNGNLVVQNLANQTPLLINDGTLNLQLAYSVYAAPHSTLVIPRQLAVPPATRESQLVTVKLDMSLSLKVEKD